MSYGPIVFAIVLYSMTLLRGPGFAGDTAKFQFIGYVLGTPHETGYPLYGGIFGTGFAGSLPILPATRMKSIAYRNPEYFYKSVESSRNVPMRDALRLAGVRYELIGKQLYRLLPAEEELGAVDPKKGK